MEEVIQRERPGTEDCYFWATSNQAELDLLIVKDAKKRGVEFKYTASPKITKSMQIAITDLHLDDQREIKVCPAANYKLGNTSLK